MAGVGLAARFRAWREEGPWGLNLRVFLLHRAKGGYIKLLKRRTLM